MESTSLKLDVQGALICEPASLAALLKEYGGTSGDGLYVTARDGKRYVVTITEAK